MAVPEAPFHGTIRRLYSSRWKHRADNFETQSDVASGISKIETSYYLPNERLPHGDKRLLG